MKKLVIMLLAVSSLYASAQNNLTIMVKGLSKIEGNMSIGLYNNANKFPKVGKAYKDVEQKINSVKFIYTFNNIPNDTYAIALYHDSNKNGKMDKNFFGIPIENYGFSNGASGTFGSPDFESASFSINGDKTIIITIK